jgi:hypothetical protein
VHEWLRNLPGELAYEAIWTALWTALSLGAAWAWKNRKKLVQRGQHIHVTMKPAELRAVGKSLTLRWRNEAPRVVEGSAVLKGEGSLSATGQVIREKPSALEELFWWYWRVR